MRKVPFGMYLISGIICLLVFQIPRAYGVVVDNFSVSKDITVAVEEIKDDVRQIDRGGAKEFFSEIAKSLGDTGKKIVDTLFKPIVKVTIQISISLFKIIISFLEYLKSSF